jgi:transposase
VVPGAEGAEALSGEMLAEALEADRQLSELAEGLIGENALLREQVARLAARDAERGAGLGKLRADCAVLQRLLFGRSWEKSRPEPSAAGDPAAGDGDAAGGGDRDGKRGSGTGRKRGPGARAGRRDYR